MALPFHGLMALMTPPIPLPPAPTLPASTSTPAPSPSASLTEVPLWLQDQEALHWLIEASNGAAIGASIAVLGTVITAAAALAGVNWTVREANQRAKRDRESAEKRALEDRQGTDLRERETARHERFSHIIEQLASDRSTVRLGALYSLSALADEWHKEYDAKQEAFLARRDEAPSDIIAAKNAALGQRQACIEVLCAYLRARPIGSDKLVAADGRQWSDQSLAHAWAKNPQSMPDREARQAAVAVLRQHLNERAPFKWPSKSIRLHGAHLEQVDLSHLDLESSTLWGSHMQNADLSESNLAQASLIEAELHGARLVRTNLFGALLNAAHLHQADLSNAELDQVKAEGAKFYGTRLTGANFAGADVSGAEMLAAYSDGDGHPVTWVKKDPGEFKVVKYSDATVWPKNFSIEQAVEKQKIAYNKAEWDQGHQVLSYLESLSEEDFAAKLAKDSQLYWLQLDQFRSLIKTQIDERKAQPGLLADVDIEAKSGILNRLDVILAKLPEDSFIRDIKKSRK